MKKNQPKSRVSKRAPAVAEPRIGPDDMLPEYDFSRGVRGKYAERYAEGTNVVLLDPDVAAMFPDTKAVNNALRVIAEVARRQARGKAPAA